MRGNGDESILTLESSAGVPHLKKFRQGRTLCEVEETAFAEGPTVTSPLVLPLSFIES